MLTVMYQLLCVRVQYERGWLWSSSFVHSSLAVQAGAFFFSAAGEIYSNRAACNLKCDLLDAVRVKRWAHPSTFKD